MIHKGSLVLSSTSCYHCDELINHKWDCPWNIIHKFKPKKGYKFSGPCTVCGYTKTNERQHGHSCIGKVISPMGTETYCYECFTRYERSDIPAYVKAR